ncbi:hypothetical protein PsalMR5_02358 [Piscirickettsia salmonis]|uniref:hypothetical protein n=1 Tax=Piscirickettsia salmonis TaxID=1238 RepID=UPI0012BAE975|nr:hypothetical protein [Piscirickettsia salmonis]QGP54323.1 hypothetical protein PsalSR1_01755 [Piscirickettsia salmonis]QGP59781.1 hypothetical protein PsalBI1_02378 [Piscirickettsia salmonis]QGP64483.1 hypothetical protein PsalMR5_02358 [Piscirickettsia salmonis]
MNNYSLDLAYVEINSEKYLNVISYQEKLSLSSLPEIALEFLVEKKLILMKSFMLRLLLLKIT